MATLDKLMALPGALAAFEFRGSGEILKQHINDNETISVDTLDMLAHMCAANVSIASMQARGWEKVTDMKGFYPIKEFTLVGFDWSVIVSAVDREASKSEGKDLLTPFLGVVVDNGAADFEAAFKAMES